MGVDGRAIGEAFVGLIVVIAVGAFCLGGLVFWGVPKLWALLKPFIHAITA